MLKTAALLLALALRAAAQEDSVPFMAVELKMAPFKGAHAGDTQKSAESFLAGAGYRVLAYQDNEAVRAVDVILPPQPDGALAKLRYSMEKMKVQRRLRGGPHVKSVQESGGGRLVVIFEPFVYPPEVEALREVVPAGARLAYFRNPNMQGLWINLDVSGVKDAAAAAREFAARYPEQVASAEIKIRVKVLSVGASGR